MVVTVCNPASVDHTLPRKQLRYIAFVHLERFPGVHPYPEIEYLARQIHLTSQLSGIS